MRMLALDLETSPNLADVWGLFNQNVGLNQLRESTRVICFGAKWFDTDKYVFRSEHHHGREEMIQALWDLLNEADVVVTWNGRSFDEKHANREFVENGLGPPSPYKSLDLMQVVKRKFRFPSNKLQYVSTALGLEGKVQTGGHELWVKCMAGDNKAWNTMRRYQKQDVDLLPELYDKLRPWITNLPAVALYNPELDTESCPTCGSTDRQKRGYQYTATARFQKYYCKGCTGWYRSGKADMRVDPRPA